ncbi:MAG: DUF1326 domain-containing protein [Chloroflexi bacterium]|nr:MAG: DUF1326 domain-containing protein [Chloroflexota bacterium]
METLYGAKAAPNGLHSAASVGNRGEEGIIAQDMTAATQLKTKFLVEGDYFEDHCDVFIGWHVRNGKMGDVDLKGLDAALVISSPSRARRTRHLPAAAGHGLPGMTT